MGFAATQLGQPIISPDRLVAVIRLLPGNGVVVVMTDGYGYRAYRRRRRTSGGNLPTAAAAASYHVLCSTRLSHPQNDMQ